MDDDTPPRVAQHEAVDRFGKATLRTVHGLTAALAENDGAGEEPIVHRTGGPHRSLDGLAALLDAALADEGLPDDRRPDGPHADHPATPDRDRRDDGLPHPPR
jgi:hypothetical protein